MYIGKTLIKLSNGGVKDLMTLWLSRKEKQVIRVANQELTIRKIMHPITINRRFSDLYPRPKVTSLQANDLLLRKKKSF